MYESTLSPVAGSNLRLPVLLPEFISLTSSVALRSVFVTDSRFALSPDTTTVIFSGTIFVATPGLAPTIFKSFTVRVSDFLSSASTFNVTFTLVSPTAVTLAGRKFFISTVMFTSPVAPSTLSALAGTVMESSPSSTSG